MKAKEISVEKDLEINDLLNSIEEIKNNDENLILVEENKKLIQILKEKEILIENLERTQKEVETELFGLNHENNKLKEEFTVGFTKRGFCC